MKRNLSYGRRINIKIDVKFDFEYLATEDLRRNNQYHE